MQLFVLTTPLSGVCLCLGCNHIRCLKIQRLTVWRAVEQHVSSDKAYLIRVGSPIDMLIHQKLVRDTSCSKSIKKLGTNFCIQSPRFGFWVQI